MTVRFLGALARQRLWRGPEVPTQLSADQKARFLAVLSGHFDAATCARICEALDPDDGKHWIDRLQCAFEGELLLQILGYWIDSEHSYRDIVTILREMP